MTPDPQTPDASPKERDTRIGVGSVVQIDPAHDDTFAACFLVVTEMKAFGVMGYVKVPDKGRKSGDAYYRVAFEHIAYIGESEWAYPEDSAHA